MTISQAFNDLHKELSMIYDDREAHNIAKIVMEDCFGITNPYVNGDFDNSTVLFEEIIPRLAANEPVQYITEIADFYGLKLKVNKHVLIPRPETEELVEWILSDHPQNRQSIDILDIGSGSGCIPLALKSKRKSWRVFGCDISLDAVNVALINARRLKLDVDFFNFDFLDSDQWMHMGQFDVIVSNPPYISRSDKDLTGSSVLNFEPDLALFPPGNDPLVFYEKIADFSKQHLRAGGAIYVEINEFLSEETLELFQVNFPDSEVVLRQDLQGKDRMLKIVP